MPAHEPSASPGVTVLCVELFAATAFAALAGGRKRGFQEDHCQVQEVGAWPLESFAARGCFKSFGSWS